MTFISRTTEDHFCPYCPAAMQDVYCRNCNALKNMYLYGFNETTDDVCNIRSMKISRHFAAFNRTVWIQNIIIRVLSVQNRFFSSSFIFEKNEVKVKLLRYSYASRVLCITLSFLHRVYTQYLVYTL